VPGKDGVTRDARRYVRGAGGGLGGRGARGAFTIVPYAKTEIRYYKSYFVHNIFFYEGNC
jgi:hypothetical protein